MSSELHRLIGRAFADQNLRNQLLANPKAILASLNLTTDEKQMVMAGVGRLNANSTLAQVDKALGGRMLGW